ncbi:MAG: hypothetical protein M9904_06450 [Chitinophagaceae bacterium]|nr:hypothetical protein [Chitinophagaceae bacterium]
MDTLITFLTLVAIFVIISVLVIHYFNFRLKKYIIDSNRINDKELAELLKPSQFHSEFLKWGLILLFAGAGLIVIDIFEIDIADTPLPYGIETMFIAAGFLLYYLMVRNKKS